MTSAYSLARRGWHVEIVDRASEIAEGASKGNGRQLSYGHCGALARPSILAQLPKLAVGADDAFRLSLGADPKLYAWLLQFLTNCTESAYRNNTRSCLLLAEESRRSMDQLLAKNDLVFDRRMAGKMVVLQDEAALSSAGTAISLAKRIGKPQHILSRDEAREFEPALTRMTGQWAGVLYSPHDETGDCPTFCSELMGVLNRDYGVRFRANAEVTRIRCESGRAKAILVGGEYLQADHIVVASGHCANRLLAPLGLRQPIAPMKGYSFTAPLGEFSPTASVTDTRRRIVFTNIGTRMLVAGIADLGRKDTNVENDRLELMVSAARDAMPEAARYSERDDGWAGIRPVTPNSLPITKMVAPEISVNVGHGMLGWTLAMGSAERLGTLIQENALSL